METSYIKRKNKGLTIIVITMLFLIMWIYGGWNTYNSDFLNYEFHYYSQELYSDEKLDIGFYTFLNLFYKLGLSFIDARIIMYGFFLGIICFIVYKWSRVPIMVILVFFSCHFIRDVVEMRHFMAFVILLCVIQNVGCDKMRNKLLLLGGILLASSCHIAYLSFLFLLIVKNDRLMKFYIWFPLFFGFSFLFSGYAEFFGKLFGSERLDEKLEGYLGLNHIANIASFLVVSFSTSIVYVFASRLGVFQVSKHKGPKDKVALLFPQTNPYVIVNINILSSVFILLSSINFSFTGRLYGNIVLINLIYMTNITSRNSSKNNLNYIILLLLYILFTVYVFSMSGMHYKDVFSNNMIIK